MADEIVHHTNAVLVHVAYQAAAHLIETNLLVDGATGGEIKVISMNFRPRDIANSLVQQTIIESGVIDVFGVVRADLHDVRIVV